MKIISTALLLLISAISYSQNDLVEGKIESTDSTSLNVITVRPENFPNISVVFEAIKDGSPIFGLQKDQIQVFEDSIPCTVISLTEISDNYPINISLILDHSGSMADDYRQLIDSITGSYKDEVKFGLDSLGYFTITQYPKGYVKPITNAKKAIKKFISEFSSPKDSIQLIGFSTRVDIVSKFSTNKEYLGQITDSIKTDSSTAFLDALEYSINELRSRKGIRIVVALTDGLDNSSHITSKQIIKLSTQHNIPIYNIGLGNVNKDFLKEISLKTNGGFFYTQNSNALGEIYQEIQKRIMSIYDLRYESTNLENTDTTRTIEIQFNIDSLYLTDNLFDVNIPKETIEYINKKRKKEKLKLDGLKITGTLIGTGLILFVFVRQRKKKKA